MQLSDNVTELESGLLLKAKTRKRIKIFYTPARKSRCVRLRKDINIGYHSMYSFASPGLSNPSDRDNKLHYNFHPQRHRYYAQQSQNGFSIPADHQAGLFYNLRRCADFRLCDKFVRSSPRYIVYYWFCRRENLRGLPGR